MLISQLNLQQILTAPSFFQTTRNAMSLSIYFFGGSDAFDFLSPTRVPFIIHIMYLICHIRLYITSFRILRSY